jgi:hypothetical protein
MRLLCALFLCSAMVRSGLAQVPEAAATGQPVAVSPRIDAVHRVDPSQTYHRVYARVPLIGTGKRGDEIRPKFAPLLAEIKGDHSGILAWQMQLCDDGKSALVEFVGATPKELQTITSSTDPNVTVFERGKHTQAEIEAEFQKYKKGFTLNSFGVRAQ